MNTRYFLIAALAALIGFAPVIGAPVLNKVGVGVTADVAYAGNDCPRSWTRDACIAFLRAQIATQQTNHEKVVKKHTVKKTVRKTTKPKVSYVSWYVEVKRQKDACAVVLYEGGYRGNGKAVNVIQTWKGNGWTKRGGHYFKKLTIRESKIADLNKFTLCSCNGHNVFSKSDIRTVLRQKNVGLNDTAQLYSSGGFHF